MTRKLVLDLDTGIDDTLALAYALGSPEVELVGIMSSFGNVAVETGARNALAVLDLLGHPEVPVYLGADRALTAVAPSVPDAVTRRIHGQNGIGDQRIPDSPRTPVRAEGRAWGNASASAVAATGAPTDARAVALARAAARPNAAADFLIEAVRRYGDELVYVPTGPLTNLAVAMARAPELVRALRHVTLMGGALTIPGNVSPCAEANIANDPEAADLVFRSGLRTTMVGLDVTHQTLLTTRETARWREEGATMGATAARRATFLADMTDYYIGIYLQNNPALGGCALHDPLAVGVAIDPALVRTHGANLKVDLESAFRGRTIGDGDRLNDADKSCAVALEVDAPRFLREFMARIGRAIAGHGAGAQSTETLGVGVR